MINQRNSARFLFTICAPLQALAFVSPSATLPPAVSSSVHLRDDGVGCSTFDERQRTASLRIFSPFDKKAVQHPPTRLFENNGSVMESGEMMLAKDNRLLDMAFSALDDKDKYETVLTGLCAKVIDGGEAAAKAGLVDPIRLMEEMNSSRIVAGQRGIISLIDATALTSDARIMAKVLSLAIKNAALYNYGNLQRDITPFPRTSTSAFPFGNNNNDLVERLQMLPAIPDDDRAAEVSSALTFSAVVGTCVGLNIVGGLFGLDDLTPFTNLILGVALTTVVVDNFFDVIVMGGSTVAKMNEDKLPDAAKNVSAPKKENMPLGIGTGIITGTVVRGLSRLLSVNTERDCQCEAAAVFVAYSLGLPCFAFQPNALEGAALVIDSMRPESNDSESFNTQGKLDYLASDAGLLKILIWLMAPVAMETGKYPQLISSDPREARGFLDRLGDKAKNIQFAQEALADVLPADDAQTDDYLRWALAEADSLLRSNKKIVDSLSEALAGGAATVGDCVAILEGW